MFFWPLLSKFMLTQTWHSLIYQVLDETHEFGVYKMYILTFGAFFGL